MDVPLWLQRLHSDARAGVKSNQHNMGRMLVDLMALDDQDEYITNLIGLLIAEVEELREGN
jgi:hypothetical protein